ncbi:MAG: glycosyltransferase family 39 protein [Planctomycetaceae bacterium]
MEDHPDRIMPVYWVARWACLPFSVLGALTCFVWARDLYGQAAGFISLFLWCFSPTILGHASLITPDAGAAAVGVTACYLFWKWLRRPGLWSACLCGVLLGLTFLTKFTWIVLIPVWFGWWALWKLNWYAESKICTDAAPASSEDTQSPTTGCEVAQQGSPPWTQLAAIYVIGWWVLCNGYLMENVFVPLGEFHFSSSALSGEAAAENRQRGGNRFRGTPLEHLPVPVPRNVLQGIDHLKWEYEHGYRSYLRGETKRGGWWYYYLYAMLVKMPVGTLLLIGISAGLFSIHVGRSLPQTVRRLKQLHQPSEGTVDDRAEPSHSASSWDELYLLTPAVVILALVSSQTGFNHHLRYVLPAFPFLFIFAGRTACLLKSSYRPVRVIPLLAVAATVVSSLIVYPHGLSYFNELSGGSINGWRHLDKSNTDWGQDLPLVKEWAGRYPERRPLFVSSYGMVSPESFGIPSARPAPIRTSERSGSHDEPNTKTWPPGWYIISVTNLVDPGQDVHDFLDREAVGNIAYSMRVYHVPEKDGVR